MAQTYKDILAYKEKNIQFLEENAMQPGVEMLSNGVQYKVLTKGRGTIPSARSLVKVHYKGSLVNGKIFDDSFKRKRPESFRVNELIKGWQIALRAMPAGSRWMVYIPCELGYGSTACDGIPAYSTLIFEMDLLEVK